MLKFEKLNLKDNALVNDEGRRGVAVMTIDDEPIGGDYHLEIANTSIVAAVGVAGTLASAETITLGSNCTLALTTEVVRVLEVAESATTISVPDLCVKVGTTPVLMSTDPRNEVALVPAATEDTHTIKCAAAPAAGKVVLKLTLDYADGVLTDPDTAVTHTMDIAAGDVHFDMICRAVDDPNRKPALTSFTAHGNNFKIHA